MRFLSILLFLVSFSSLSQPLDSLKSRLKEDMVLDDRLELLSTITAQSMYSSLDSTKKYGELMISLSGEGESPKSKIMHPQALHLIATSYHIKNRIDTASIIYLKAIDQFQKLIDQNDSRDNAAIYWECIKRQSRSYNNLALCYFNESIYDTAVIYYQEAINLNLILVDNSTEWSDKALSDIGGIYTNLGLLMERQAEYEKALSYGWKAKSFLQQGNDKRALMYCLTNLGAYNSFIDVYDSSLLYYNRSLELANELNDEYQKVHIESNLGTLFMKLERWTESIDHLTEAYFYYEKYADIKSMLVNEQALAEAHLAYGNYDSALYYLEKVLIHGKEISAQPDLVGSLNLAMQIYADLARRFSSVALYDSALAYSERYHAMNDSLFNEAKDKNLKELEVRFESERKEKDNLLLREENDRQRLILTFISTAGFLLLILLFVIYRFYISRKRIALELAADKELITTQANKLKALDQFKSRFFANVSHDLRTPLTLIQGHILQLRSDDNYLSARSEQNLGKLEKNTLKLIRLTDEIKDLIQLENDKLQIKYQKISIKSYLSRLVNLFSSAAELKRIDLHFETDVEDELIIHLDSNQFEKILYNLIANALRFTPQNGNIGVYLKKENDLVKITIEDNGAGISKEKIDYIFDRFYQADNEWSGSNEGIGIGLSLALELVKLHNGTLDVQSEEGAGTTFTISLPMNLGEKVTNDRKEDYVEKNKELLVEEEAISEGLFDIDENEKKANGANVAMIVDDHPDIRHHIKELIQDKYIIRQANNGQEALKILHREKVDVVITDLMMPWMDGHELIDEMKETEPLSKIPVLVVSARTTEEDKLKVLENGVNDFLAKPFHPEDLKLRIDNLIDNGRSSEIWDQIATDKKKLSDIEKNILSKLNTLILSRIDDSTLSVRDLSEELVTSSRNAFNMISQMTGMSPKDYMDEVRIRYAEDLIKNRKVRSVTEAAQALGMSNSTHFSRKFQKKTGKHPSELLK